MYHSEISISHRCRWYKLYGKRVYRPLSNLHNQAAAPHNRPIGKADSRATQLFGQRKPMPILQDQHRHYNLRLQAGIKGVKLLILKTTAPDKLSQHRVKRNFIGRHRNKVVEEVQQTACLAILRHGIRNLSEYRLNYRTQHTQLVE